MASIKFLSTPPTDTFTKSLLSSIIAEIDDSYEVFYTWTAKWEPNFYKKLPITRDKVIVVVKDLIGNDDAFGELDKGKDLKELANQWPSKKFIFALSVENAAEYFAENKNVMVVHIGGDWLNQIAEYQELIPVATKNANSTEHFISLTRGPRSHRVVSTSYLISLGLDKIGKVTFMNAAFVNFPTDDDEHLLLANSPWDFATVHPMARLRIMLGFDMCIALYAGKHGNYNIYSSAGENNNIANFNDQLRPMYENSYVEIVNETTFMDSTFLLTEKTMHVFAAYNIPIMISSVGTVKFLRELGFDMFDDIVDHSYDMEPDPVKRIVMAIDNNYVLLHNRDLAKQKWQECLPRFEKNWEFISSGKLAQWYEARTRKEFSAALVG